MELTREQLAIMRHKEGPALVTAGAGCGKTTLLVEYLAQKLRKPGAGQKKILVLTFSNSACEELYTRLHQRLATNKTGKITGYENVHIMTYDAFGYAIVRQHYDELGFQTAPTVIENTDLVKQCVAEVVTLDLGQEMALNQRAAKEIKKTGKQKKKELMRDVLIEKKIIASGAKTRPQNPQVTEVLQLYKKHKKSQNLVDFDDMVGRLMGNKKWLTIAAREYRYLLVDELQDTSVKQTQMLITLVQNIETSVMVGDPKQNINVFRGAFKRNWDTMKAELEPVEYKLTETHRLPRSSLPFVNAIGDEIHPGAQLVSDVKGQRVRVVHRQNVADQAQFIADKIKWLKDYKEVRPSEIVCLGRTRRLLSDLSVALEGHGIVTQELYREPQTGHAKGLRNLLRLTRWLRQQPGEGGFELPDNRRQALSSWLKQLGVDASQINTIFNKTPKRGWKAVGITSRTNGKESPGYRRILDFRKLIAKAAKSEELEKATSYLMDALRKVLRRDRDKQTVDFLMRDLTQLKIKIRQFASWEDLSIKELDLKNTQDSVQLSTINGAKGKEWRYVFVIHCVNGILPIHYAKTDEHLDSEKMLLYVASTRHSKGLYLMDAPGSIVNYKGGKNKNRRVDVVFSDCSPFILPHKEHLRVLGADLKQDKPRLFRNQ